MPALTPEFLFDLESNMRVISANEYERLLKTLWWQLVCKTLPSGAKKERISWLLDTARIQRTNHGGGNITFEDIVMNTVEYENENAAAGLEMKKENLEDLDGNGVKVAAHWSRQMGAYAAYWPQKILAAAIRDNGNTYDGLPFFSANGAPHPVNPFKIAAGTFANRFTAGASGSYPGALPIDVSGAATVDIAVQNLAKAIAYIATVKMPNGEDPRGLRVKYLLHPPALTARAQQITNAKFIAQAASSGGGSGDVSAVIANFGLGQPVECPELAAAFGGSDTTWYLACEEVTTDELGAFVYVNREPFSMIMHGPMTDAELARTRKFQWTTEGRNTLGNGHPYLLFRCDAA